MAGLTAQCDLFEIRADAFDSAPDLPLIFRNARRPILWTHRTPEEGGRDNPRQHCRLGEYRQALDLGARWIDVEWKSGLARSLPASAGKVVLSLHDFEKTPTELPSLIAQMAETPCGVIKVATQINRTEDVCRLVESARQLKRQRRAFVIAGMGEDGNPLRILSSILGSEWTYVALDEPTARGQLTAADLELYRFRALGPRSWIFAVIGNPISHSRSPLLHNRAYQEMRFDAVYLAVRVDDLSAYLRLAETLGISGWSVTLPWKREMAARCVLQDQASHNSGVVNTVRREGDRLLGWNTDWAGFLEPLRRRFPVAGLRACVLGTGGAARTAVAALVSEGAQVRVLGRRPEALQAFAADFAVATGSLEGCSGVAGDLIVNATPVGMAPAAGAMPAPGSLLERFRVAYDLIYTPPATAFLRAARELGLQTISGWEMFVEQAAAQIRIFTGAEPPADWLERERRNVE